VDNQLQAKKRKKPTILIFGCKALTANVLRLCCLVLASAIFTLLVDFIMDQENRVRIFPLVNA
jgi:hypothetical protein